MKTKSMFQALFQRQLTRRFYAVVFLGIGSLQAFSQSPAWQWAKSIGGIDADIVNEVSCDNMDHVYSTGYFYGAVDFDTGPGSFGLTTFGGAAFVSKMNEAGHFVWARAFTGLTSNDFSESFAVALNKNGNGEIYTTGYFGGTVDFDPGVGIFNITASGSNIDIFVCKLDSSGNFIWARAFQNIFSSAVSYGITLTLDPSGNGDVYTAGNFTGLVDFDPDIGTYNLASSGLGFTDMFISKLNGSGNLVWARRMGGPDNDLIRCILADSVSGRLYTTGYFAATADLEPGTGVTNFTAAGDWDAFLGAMDTSGNFIWAKPISGVGRDLGMSLTMDPSGSGSIFSTGSFNGTTDFDPDTSVVFNMTSASYDVFILKVDSSGNFTWAKSMGGTGGDEAFSIQIDPTGSGDIYTTGYFETTCDFDPGPATYNITEAGGGDVFLSKLDSAGNFAWARAMGGAGSDYGDDLDISSSGKIFLAGMFESSTVAFDSTMLSNVNTGFDDMFIAKLDTAIVTGIVPVLSASGISIFPNPVENELTIRYDQPEGIVKLEIYNVTGKKYFEKISEKTSPEEKVNMSQFAAGAYFIKVFTRTDAITLKVVKAVSK